MIYAADPVDADIVVDRADHWVFAGSGLTHSDAPPGLLGYEVDATYRGGPPGLARLAHSPFTEASAQGQPARTRYADMTIYQAGRRAAVRGGVDPVELGARRLQRARMAHGPRERRGAAHHAHSARPHAADGDHAGAPAGRVAAEPDHAARLGPGDGICPARVDME